MPPTARARHALGHWRLHTPGAKKPRQRRRRRRHAQPQLHPQHVECSSSSSQPLPSRPAGRQQQGAVDASSKPAHAQASSEPITVEQLIAMTRSWDLTHSQPVGTGTSSSSLAANPEHLVCGSPRTPFPETVSSQLSQRLLLLDALRDSTTSAAATAAGEEADCAYTGTFSPIGGSPRVSFQGSHTRVPPGASTPAAGPSSNAGPLAAAPSTRPLFTSDLLLQGYRSQLQLGSGSAAAEPVTSGPRAALHSSSSAHSSGALGAGGLSGMGRGHGGAAAEAYHPAAPGRGAVCSSSDHAAGRDQPVPVAAALGRAAGAAADLVGSPQLSTLGPLIPLRAFTQRGLPPHGAATAPATPYCSPHVSAAGGSGPAGGAGDGPPADLQQLLGEVEAELAASPATPAMVRARHLLRRVAAAAQQQQQQQAQQRQPQGPWAVGGQAPDVARASLGEPEAVGSNSPWGGGGSGSFASGQMVDELQGVLGSSLGPRNAVLLQCLLQGGPDAFSTLDNSSCGLLEDWSSKPRSAPEQLGAHALSSAGHLRSGITTGPLPPIGSTPPAPNPAGGGGSGDLGMLMEAWGLNTSCSGAGASSSSGRAGPLVSMGEAGLAVSRYGPGPDAAQHHQTGSAALATYADVALLEALDLSLPAGGASWEGPLAAQSIWQDMLQELHQPPPQQQQEYTSGGGGWLNGASVQAFEQGQPAAMQAAGLLPGVMHMHAVEQQQVGMDPSMVLLCQQLLQGGYGVEGVGAAQLSQQAPPATRSSSATSSTSSSSRQLLMELLLRGDAAGSSAHGAGPYLASSGGDPRSGGGSGGGGLGNGGRAGNQVVGGRPSLERQQQQQQQVLATSKLLASLAAPSE